VGVATQKFSDVLNVPVAERPFKFLNPPLLVVAIEGPDWAQKNHVAKEVQSHNFKGISIHV